MIRQTVRAYLWRSARKFWPLTPRLSRSLRWRSLETARTNRLSITSYLFFLVTTALSHTVSKINGDICQKNPTPLYSTPSLKGFPLEFCNGGGDGKSRCPYHVKKCADMSLRFDTEQNRHWTDRQTERQTELVKQYRVLHARSAIDAR